MIPLNNYLSRIHLSLDYLNTLDIYNKLKIIILHHSLYIPFENINVLLKNKSNIPISLHINDIIDKLINNNQGGYCFEHNKLLGLVLKQLGYKVITQGCRVILEPKKEQNKSSSITHIALFVSHNSIKDKIWLVDVGFGSFSPIEPILFNLNDKSRIFKREYYFKQREYTSDLTGYTHSIWQLYCCTNINKKSDVLNHIILYEFDLTREIQDNDLNLANYYICTHPESLFVTNLFINGLINKSDNNLFRLSLWNLQKTETDLQTGNKIQSIIEDKYILKETLQSLGIIISLDKCENLYNIVSPISNKPHINAI